MTKPVITSVTADEILDSRGDPTVCATIALDDGRRASASVPSGASTGAHEAVELRDGGQRFGGRGVQKAVQHVATVINKRLQGTNLEQQQEIDQQLVTLDGTDDRRRLGANAMLSVSCAYARLAARVQNVSLHQYLRRQFGLSEPRQFPAPMCNVLNGGRHADNHISFQEYLVLAEGSTVMEKIERTSSLIRTLKTILHKRGSHALVGDEGGFAPSLKENEEGLLLLNEAAKIANLDPGNDVSFGIDAAASEFYNTVSANYRLLPENTTYDSTGLVQRYDELAARYALTTIEDGMAEDDWTGWSLLTRHLGHKLLLIGDDLFVTKKRRLLIGEKEKAANAIVIKLNQVGTLSETMETVAAAKRQGYELVVSHRSGETCDDFIADLAVAVGSRYLKAGSLMRSERTAKYNRLWHIATEVGA